MNVTELLITGYDRDKSVFAIALAPDGATVVHMAPGEAGEMVADAITTHATDVFAGIRELLEGLTLMPLGTEPQGVA